MRKTLCALLIPSRFTLCNVTEFNDLYVMNNSSNDE